MRRPPPPPLHSLRLCLWLLVLAGAVAGRRDSCGDGDGYGEFASSGEASGWSSVAEDVCGAGSGPFCFPSTLVGDVQRSRGGGSMFRMRNGWIVSCFLKDSPPASRDDVVKDIEAGLDDSLSPPHIDITPSVLDWGRSGLYSPSSALLRVGNTHSENVLLVNDLFSTDPQFYASGFEKMTLGPGESGMIDFVFLPRWVGEASGYVVMQTSLGGFVIRAKGVGVESPYKLEMVFDGSVNWSLSLYNPFGNVLHVEEVSAWISDVEDSAHVVCSVNASHPSFDESSPLLSEEWLTVNSREFGLPLVDVRLYEQWEVPPYSTLAILGMKLGSHLEGSISGTICMKLRDTKFNRANTVIVPIKVDARSGNIYRRSSGSLAVFLEPLVPCDGREFIFSLSAVNKASYSLSVVGVSVVTESPKLFREVNYMKGLILYPKSVSQIAFISYIPHDSYSDTFEDLSPSFNCELWLVTNDSADSEINIPCHNFIRTCLRYQPGSNIVASDGFGMVPQHGKETSANTHTRPLGVDVEEPLTLKQKFSDVAKAEEIILRNWRSQGTMDEMSVIKDPELLFPAVQIGTYSSKWISVHNPSKKPVIMQLVLNSGVIVDQCKSDNDLSENTFPSMFAPIDSNEIQDGFSLGDSARTEAFVHPLSSALFGPVLFHPSKRCMWRSSALIRNNLSGFESLSLRAFGGSPSLVLLEGSEPVRKLEFNLDLPISVNLSSWNILPLTATSSFSCGHLISKELYAKNTGELPLEVSKIDVSGSSCGLGGFMIQNCKGFALAPGESRKLSISYQSDFSAAVVHRELELAMATGIFVIPMKAILPVHMLKLCRKSFFRSTLWVLSILVLAVAFVVCLVILRMNPHVSLGAEYCVIKNDKAITNISTAPKRSRPHRNSKANSRLVGEDESTPDVIYTGGHPSCPNSAHSSTKRMQSRQELDQQKKTTISLPLSTAKPVAVLSKFDVLDSPSRAADLSVRVVTERGRRRKKRSAGATSSAKFDVSSSQSGNSTPSSPLSPSATTLKQIWSLSTDVAGNSSPEVPEQNSQKKHDTKYATARAPQAEKRYDGTWLQSAQDRPHVSVKSPGRPTLLASASFPSCSSHAPVMAGSNFLDLASPIAPHARAPGSKLSKDDACAREDSDVIVKDFTYDIWGNYFCDRMLGRPKGVPMKVFDASEGDSQSFFAREPQSLMMMSSAHSVSPGQKSLSNDVNHLYEMN